MPPFDMLALHIHGVTFGIQNVLSSPAKSGGMA